jgi:hypothetical protein
MQKRLGILILILILGTFDSTAIAASQYSATLTTMEKSLFGIDYSTQSDDVRVKRLEEEVYGASTNAPIATRVGKLSKSLSADVIKDQIKPKRDTFEDPSDSIKEDIPKADPNVNYPIVNKLEDKVFRKEFKTTDINQRLANLERSVFKKTYSDDLNSRVDRLRAAVLPQSLAQNNSEDDDTSGYDYYSDSGSKYVPNRNDTSDLLSQNNLDPNNILSPNNDDGDTGFASPVPQYNQKNSVRDNYQGNGSDILVPLASLEKSVLKKAFPDDTVSNRLTRLELTIFSSSFVDDDPETRLDRLSSAYRARKSAKKYDSNKFAQHAATAMQIGAILLMILAAVL